MKTVGIIGGLGPETSAKFLLDLNFEFIGVLNKVRPPILLWNVPMDLKKEKRIILNGKEEEFFLGLLKDGAQRLEKGGVDFIVIPCNTAHLFIDEVRNSVKIPVLSIIEETAKALTRQSVQKVGLMATGLIVKKNLFGEEFKKHNIDVVFPNKDDQIKTNIIINDLVLGKNKKIHQKEFNSIINNFKKHNVFSVLLACTDLQLLNPKSEKITFFDTLKILQESTLRKISE